MNDQPITHPINERHFHCSCGAYHEWAWGVRRMNSPEYTNIYCPSCGVEHRKVLTEKEINTWFGIYGRKRQFKPPALPVAKPELPNTSGEYDLLPVKESDS